MELLIILFLILLNGVFSMSEIALISARKNRLETAAKKGNKNAKAALDLANSPNEFLSTVQIIALFAFHCCGYCCNNLNFFLACIGRIIAQAHRTQLS
jgi:Mg2+/Co2+ transporter CorB